MRDSQMQWGGPFPSLHLWPIQDTFVMKMIHLPEGQRIKVGRQTNTKTVPGERNAYFDSKVLSRLHAEIWEHSGKIYIKDVKSSNGTFINGDRLSPEGVESEPRELHNEDVVEFGIDIVSDDNRTIVHHKVAAKVYCVFGPEDAATSARELARHNPPRRGPAVNAAPPVLSAGGKPNGLTFDHVLLKLQAEIARSKETGAELQSMSAAMTDIQDVLSGGLAPEKNGSAAEFIPPQFRSTTAQSPHGQSAAAVIALQNQLSDTQASLTGQGDKISRLENQLREQDSLRSEIAAVREELDSHSRDRSSARDDDDAKSVMTVMDNEEAEERVRERRQQSSQVEEENAKLAAQVQTLSAEVAEAVRLSKTWQAQHSDAMDAVRLLTERVGALEAGITSRIAEEVAKTETRWQTWRNTLEEGWKKERETWEKERERLRTVVRDWEEASRRANEEEEERALNERLSGGSGSEGETEPPPLRRRRRRPSSRTTLAVRALRNLADETGSTTPKPVEPSARRPKGTLARRESASTLKETLSSDGESGDTLSEPVKAKIRKKPIQPGPVIMVGFIAIVVGAVYYQSRE